MLLKKLQIFGFKSFADKTELTFGEGITAIIGPNGCGKSNVVDAIRWVFGEQKPSLLRGNTMQDVIFSGTQSRHPLNMAEVVITIENTKGILPVEYSEVSITRRLYRNGESEYLLNKVPCRLRDIQNLFLDTGIGSTAYTTIENSMINSILSDKTEERRVLFEEAAGIGKYKQRRKESLRQLEKTRMDLLRINDRVMEAERQVRMLARHVEKAKKYKSYYEDLKKLELGFELRRFNNYTKEINELKKNIEEIQTKIEGIKAKILTAETEIEKKQLLALEKEKELESASRVVSESNEKISHIDRDISVTIERLSNIRKNIERFEMDLQLFEKQIEENIKQRSELEKSIVEKESQLLQTKEKVSSAKETLSRFDNQMSEKRTLAEQLNREQIRLIHITGEKQTIISKLKSDLSNTIDRKGREQEELEQITEKIEEYKEAIEICKRQLEIVNEEHQHLLESRERLVKRIEEEEKRYQNIVETEKRLEAQIESAKNQKKFLLGLESAYEGYGSGVKELLKRKVEGLKGILADIISVTDEKLVPLVEKILGSLVQIAIFDTEEQVSKAIELLNRERLGEACLLSLERLNSLQIKADRTFENSICLSSIVKVAPEYKVIADKFLSYIYITDDSKKARDLALQSGIHYYFAAPNGVICKGDGTIIAGTSESEKAGILQRKQQIEKLTNDIAAFEKKYAEILVEKDRCILTRDEAKIALIEIDEKLSMGQRRQHEQQTTIKHYEKEIENYQEKIVILTGDIATLEEKIKLLEENISKEEMYYAEENRRLKEVEEQLEKIRTEIKAMEEERKVLSENFRNIELESQTLTNHILQEKNEIKRITKEISSLEERKLFTAEEKRKALDEIAELNTLQERMKLELQYHCSIRTEKEKIRDALREEYNGILMEIEAIRKGMRTDQTEFEELSNRLHQEQLKLSQYEQEQRRIRERMWEAYEVDIASSPDNIVEVTEDEETVLNTINMYKERIKHIGQVNLAALEDYETESQRLKELTTQRDDLQKAVDDLERAIKKLDKEAREKFCATFEEVKKYFSEMFTTLFEGGEAHLHLEENVDPLEAPIHINVRPTGKKMRGVQLLSAGERALTAISLLFALYLVKPSAYCVLDELDAPLDDANIGRFIKILKKFSEKTQFIVITHNKRTMEAADVLYGVTQKEKGVSTIVSVRFDNEDAERKAA